MSDSVVRIIVNFESSLRNIAGVPSTEIDLPSDSSVLSLMDRLVERFGQEIVKGDQEYHWRHSANYVVVVRNGEAIIQDHYANTQLAEGDHISLVPPVAGG